MVVSAGHLNVYLMLLNVLKHVFLHVRSTEISFLRQWFCQMLKLTLPGVTYFKCEFVYTMRS